MTGMLTDEMLISLRLHHQRLSRTVDTSPVDVVRWMGAIQAQDYDGAKWAINQRLAERSHAAIEQAFNRGEILRTHILRPTWHFVTPADIRSILSLSAARVHAVNAYYYRQLELDETAIRRSVQVLEAQLQGGQERTRPELVAALQQAGLSGSNLRFSYIMMHAELDGLICSGGRRGKQFTYALLDERVPAAPVMDRDEALADLTIRYFASRGPATVKDFVWWSGLTGADARRGLEMTASRFERQEYQGRTCWFAPETLPAPPAHPVVYLLPNYDEYTISYRDHSPVFDRENLNRLKFLHILILNGRVAGTWRRTLGKREVTLEIDTFKPLLPLEAEALQSAAEQYAGHQGLQLAWA